MCSWPLGGAPGVFSPFRPLERSVRPSESLMKTALRVDVSIGSIVSSDWFWV